MHNALLPPTTQLKGTKFFIKDLKRTLTVPKKKIKEKENTNKKKNPITLYIQKNMKLIKVKRKKGHLEQASELCTNGKKALGNLTVSYRDNTCSFSSLLHLIVLMLVSQVMGGSQEALKAHELHSPSSVHVTTTACSKLQNPLFLVFVFGVAGLAYGELKSQ